MRKIIIISAAILITAFMSWQIYLPVNSSSSEEALFIVKKGDDSRDIAYNLQKGGFIRWSPIFRIYVLMMGVSGKLQAGVYSLSFTMNMPVIASKFVSGDIAKAKITIPEGFTAEQIHGKLKNVTMSDVVTLENYQGYLFPDTYKIAYGMALEDIIKMMKDNFDRKTVSLKITPEIMVMASLLEKEVKTKEEKELVSGVLWKRMRAKIPLQVDAEMWTYKNLGLPPKPIANPGLESIEAALYPKDNVYWYYLSTPEGKTIFSKTLEEHNYAKAKHLK